MGAQTATTVLVVDDHVVVREGLRAALAEYDDLAVCGTAEDGAAAVTLVEQLSPDLVLMDLAMPTMDGLEATRQILELRPGTGVVVLSAFADRDHIRDALDAGARGYVVKGEPVETIVEAIRSVRRGEPGLSPRVRAELPG